MFVQEIIGIMIKTWDDLKFSLKIKVFRFMSVLHEIEFLEQFQLQARVAVLELL